MRVAGGSLLSVADGIAQAGLAVIAVSTGVWFRTAHLKFCDFYKSCAVTVARTVLCCTQTI